jgi:hydrogenase nickel incorporation protein HypA/HybF
VHELSITQGILDLVLDHAARAGAARVSAIHLVIGGLSGVVDDSVRFCWDLISEGTPAQGAVLDFRRVPLRLACRECPTLFAPDGVSFDCPACGARATRVVEGREFRVESIDIEDPVAGEESS